MLHINDQLDVYRNQLDREAIVLAVYKNKALIEYTMPNGTSALNIIASDDVHGEGVYRSVSYYGLTLRWLNRLIEDHMAWEGRPQKASHARRPAMLYESNWRQQHEHS